MRIALTIGAKTIGGSSDIELALEEARNLAVDLLVTGEMSLDEGGGIASDHPRIDALDGLVAEAGIGLLLGYRERCSTGTYSAAQLIDTSGCSIANYRCAHPAGTGLDLGNWLTVATIGRRCTGLLLGDDILLPEMARALVLKGATMLLALRASPFQDRAMRNALLRTRAVENGVPVLALIAGEATGHAADGRALPTAASTSCLAAIEVPGTLPPIVPRRPELYRQLLAVDEPWRGRAE